MAHEIVTEDGVSVREGSRVFNYYDRKWGTIKVGTVDRQGWFTLVQDDRTTAILNGERICSAKFAESQGW